jgi:hypothetical protein
MRTAHPLSDFGSIMPTIVYTDAIASMQLAEQPLCIFEPLERNRFTVCSLRARVAGARQQLASSLQH